MAKQTAEQKASQPDQYTPVVAPSGEINYVANENLDAWLGAGSTLVDSGGSELSLGGDNTGTANPNPTYNPITGGYDMYGGNTGAPSQDENPDYKQHVFLGTEHGTVWLPPDVTSAEFLANPGAYETVDNADGFSRTVTSGGGGGGTTPPPTGGGGTPPPSGGGGTPPPSGGGGGTAPPSTGGGSGTLPGDGNNPQPDGGDWEVGRRSPPRDTSWLWDSFKPKNTGDGEWGGYDEDYQAFERYQPGMDSPWGMPNIEGGNKEFYQQQFANLLRDDQGYQNRERAAQNRRIFAENNPQEIDAQMGSWDWANNGQGLKEVTAGTGQSAPTGYDFNDAYSGMSLQDVWGQVQDKSVFDSSDSSKSQQDVLNNYFNVPNRTDFLGGQDFSSFNDPGAAFASIDPQSWEGMNRPGVAQEGLRTILNQMYTPTGQGPSAPIGYASPV